jgi:hypothetical protein
MKILNSIILIWPTSNKLRGSTMQGGGGSCSVAVALQCFKQKRLNWIIWIQRYLAIIPISTTQSIIAHTIYQTASPPLLLLWTEWTFFFQIYSYSKLSQVCLLVTSHPWFPNLVGIRLRVRRTLQNLHKDFPDGHGCGSSKKIVRDQWDVGQF